MPQLHVAYSDTLADAFDRRAFALDAHATTAGIIGSQPSGFKTRFERVAADEAVIADGTPGQAMIYVEAAILSGRTPEVKLAFSRALLDLAVKHTATVEGLTVQTAVDIRDLDRDSYTTHTS